MYLVPSVQLSLNLRIDIQDHHDTPRERENLNKNYLSFNESSMNRLH